MKRKSLLLLTSLLLTQTAPVWAMWNEDDEKFMREAGNGQPRTHIQHTGFMPNLPPIINTLDPSDPLPENLGTARQRVACRFGDNDQIEIILPTTYPLSGQWVFEEDRDNTQNIATLKLNTLINNLWHSVYERQMPIQHELVHIGEEIPGRLYFDGALVYQARTKLQQWRNPQNNQRYSRTLATRDGEIPRHQGHTVIYTEPFAIGAKVQPKPRGAYRGSYEFSRNLSDKEQLKGREKGRLIYSDGDHYYLPYVTQELWQNDNSQAGFFIASYKQDEQINFIRNASLPNGKMSEGLYQLLSVEEQDNERTEKWQRLGEENKTFDISTSAAGVASIPGMGSLAPRVVAGDGAIQEALHLKAKIQGMIARTNEIATHQADVKELVIVLGKTGSGKSTFIHGMADRKLTVKRKGRGWEFDADPEIPGLTIGHHVVAGTTIPGVWYDHVNKIAYWDCPGFGDPQGAEQDIINAFAIDKLFHDSKVKIVLVMQDKFLDETNMRGQPFFNSLNEITNLFRDVESLKKNLSLVVTGVTNTKPLISLRALQLEAQHAGNGIKFTPHARQLLHSLQSGNGSHVFSIPAPEEEGEYREFANEKEKLINHLRGLNYVDSNNLNVNFHAGLGAESRELAGDLAQSLNQYLTSYIKTEGSQRIINYCRHIIDGHTEPVIKLREKFTALANELHNISVGTPEMFLNGLKKVCNNDVDFSEIQNTIGTIGFLKTIKETIAYTAGEWKNALIDTVIHKIKTLTTGPKVKFKGDILILKGTLVGTADINSAFIDYPNPKTVNVFGLNRLFVDEDITKPGTSISLVSPHLRVIDDKTINLSGVAGEDGADGKDGTGEHGKFGKLGLPGGNFFGKFALIDGLKNLTVNTNGGTGGIGGRGGKGRSGADGDLNFDGIKKNYPFSCAEQNTRNDRGRDPSNGVKGKTGEMLKPVNTDVSRITNYSYGSYSCTTNLHKLEFQDNGGEGLPGGDGGEGGEGGNGGSVIIDGHKNIGQSGDKGKTGEVGEVGNSGRNCTGSADVRVAYHRGGKHSLNIDSYYCSDTKINPMAPNDNPVLETSDVAPQQPISTRPLNTDQLVLDYKTYLSKKAINPNVAPFIKVFPDLQ